MASLPPPTISDTTSTTATCAIIGVANNTASVASSRSTDSNRKGSSLSWRERLVRKVSGDKGLRSDRDNSSKPIGYTNPTRSTRDSASRDASPPLEILNSWDFVEMETAFNGPEMNGSSATNSPLLNNKKRPVGSARSTSALAKGSVGSPRSVLKHTTRPVSPSLASTRRPGPANGAGSLKGSGISQNGELLAPRCPSPQLSPVPGGVLKKTKSGHSSPVLRSSSPVMVERNGPDSVSTSGPDPVPESSKTVDPQKVRDTMRVSRVKKKKKVKGSMAYSIDPYAMNSPPDLSSKYQDPFEAHPQFLDSAEEKKLGVGHEFKPMSVPRNKPEYCDHCGETAWGIRQVLKCSRCEFVVHRKCEPKVYVDCTADQAIVDSRQLEETIEELSLSEGQRAPATPSSPSISTSPTPTPTPNAPQSSISSSSALAISNSDTTVVEQADGSGNNSHSHTIGTGGGTSGAGAVAMATTSPSSSVRPASSLGGGGGGGGGGGSSDMMKEKLSLPKQIREYNKKTTPVHHIHIKPNREEGTIEYQGFVRVHMCVQRPIHVSTAITRTSWYRLMRPVKDRGNNKDSFDSSAHPGIETAFYLPTDTNRLVHIGSVTTTKELINILLKKFCVTDNPKKFSLYEEYGGDCRRLFEEDHPLQVALEASCAHRNSKLVLRDNTYQTIQWDAFTVPELSNFIQILVREEDIYADKVRERFMAWKACIQQSIKDKVMEEVAKQTQRNLATQKNLAGKKRSNALRERVYSAGMRSTAATTAASKPVNRVRPPARPTTPTPSSSSSLSSPSSSLRASPSQRSKSPQLLSRPTKSSGVGPSNAPGGKSPKPAAERKKLWAF